LFVLIWSYDTFAYLTGRRFGRHKLMERISPNKTWEGLAGGLFFTFLAAGVLYLITNALKLTGWLALSMLVSVAATFGDLCESAIKRSVGVEASGKLIPGHGGILDRFDSAIFIFPFAYLFLKFII
jgi:phosphatidate cytidylyltransferase